MKKFTKDNFNIEEALDELMRGDGVIVFSNVYNLDDIKSAWRTAQRKHQQMHEAYLKQDFNEAIKLCTISHNHFDGKMSGYYDMWIERCEFQKTQDLPKDWNGVFIATSK